MKHTTIFKLENLCLLIESPNIILDLEGCMEVMWEKQVLFTLYDIFVSLFLKPVVP